MVKQEKPLEVIKSKDGLLSYVVGELTVTEQSSFNKILRKGLGTSMTKELLPVDLSVPRNESTDNKSPDNTPIDLTIGLEHKFDNLKQLISSEIVKEPTAIDEHSSAMLDKSIVDQPIPEKPTLSSENKFFLYENTWQEVFKGIIENIQSYQCNTNSTCNTEVDG